MSFDLGNLTTMGEIFLPYYGITVCPDCFEYLSFFVYFSV